MIWFVPFPDAGMQQISQALSVWLCALFCAHLSYFFLQGLAFIPPLFQMWRISFQAETNSADDFWVLYCDLIKKTSTWASPRGAGGTSAMLSIGSCLHDAHRTGGDWWLLTRDQATLYIWQGVGGFCGDQKNDSAIKISIVALHKLMTMSSYLINSNYIEPSFPPCDEYQQSGYIPSHGDYYERPKDTGFPHHDEQSYPRSNYTETGYDYGNVPTAGLDDFGDGHHAQQQQQPLPQSHGPRLAAAPDGGAGANASKDCSLGSEVYPGVAKGKEPVVYPWMKKVHVSTGELSPRFNGRKNKHRNTQPPIEAAPVAAIYDYRAAGSVIKDPRKFYCLCACVGAMRLCCFLIQTSSTTGVEPNCDIQPCCFVNHPQAWSVPWLESSFFRHFCIKIIFVKS